MRYVVANVRLSEVQTKQVTVPPWEIPVLTVLHGDDVEVLEEIDLDRDPPDAEDEYRRLATRYSGNKENSAVAAVYGTFEAGYKKLGEEIDKASRGGPSSDPKKSRLDAIAKRHKAEADSLKARQNAERKDVERDADRRNKEHDAQVERDEEAEAEAEAEARRAAAASQPLPRSPQAQAQPPPASTRK